MKSGSPFPELLKFLESERDKVEYLNLVAELGLGAGDIELAKLLIALQLYKAYYAAIPRQIRTVHEEALAEIRQLRDEMKFEAERTAAVSAELVRWAREIKAEITAVSPQALVEKMHRRLVDDSVATLAGTLQLLTTSHQRIDSATRKMCETAYIAESAIEDWQTVSLRRVWASAFCFSLVVALLILVGIWFFYLRHQAWWLPLQSDPYETKIQHR
jgi:hypothetical protein